MRILITIVVVSLALGAAPQIPVPITSNPIAAPIEKRGLMVEIKDLARLPDTRGMRPLRIRIQQAARVSITSAIFQTAGVSSTIRAGCCTCSVRTTSPWSTRT